MTSLLEGARKLVARGSDLGGRIEALAVGHRGGPRPPRRRGRRRGPGGRRARRRPAAALRRPHRGRDRRRDRLGQVLDVQRADRARALRRRRPPPDHVVGHRLRVGHRGRRRSCSSGSASRRGTRPPATRCSTAPAARHRPPARGPRDGRRGPARPARPRLHRGRPPPRGRPDRQARRPAGVGARPAEVRRRRDPRPLPRAAGQPRRRDAGRAQPHRHRAGGPARRDARRRPPAARPGRARARCR